MGTKSKVGAATGRCETHENVSVSILVAMMPMSYFRRQFSPSHFLLATLFVPTPTASFILRGFIKSHFVFHHPQQQQCDVLHIRHNDVMFHISLEFNQFLLTQLVWILAKKDLCKSELLSFLVVLPLLTVGIHLDISVKMSGVKI